MSEPERRAIEITGRGGREFVWSGPRQLDTPKKVASGKVGRRNDGLALRGREEHGSLVRVLRVIG